MLYRRCLKAPRDAFPWNLIERHDVMPQTPFSWTNSPLQLDVTAHASSTPREKIYHRSLWAAESLWALCSFLQPGFADVLCSCRLSLQGSKQAITIDDIRSAVRQLRFEQPTIAARLAWPSQWASVSQMWPDPKDARLVYESTALESDIQRWVELVVVNRTAAVKDAGDIDCAVRSVLGEVGRGYDSPPPTLFTVHFIPCPQSAGYALVVRGAHALFDAFGLMKCMDRIVQVVATLLEGDGGPNGDLAWGEEIPRLVGSAVDYTVMPWSVGMEDEDEVMLQKAIDVLKAAKNTLGLPIPHPDARQGPLDILVRTLPGATLDGIVSAARAHGCSFYATTFAAMVLGTLRVNPPSNTYNLVVPLTFTPVNLRRKGLITRDDDVLSALGLNVLLASNLERFVGSDSHEDVWTIAREICEQMDNQQGSLKRTTVWAHPLIIALTGMMVEKAKTSGKRSFTSVTPRISSLGVIDAYLSSSHNVPNGGGKIEVSNPVVTVCITRASPLLGVMLGAHCFTWNGTLYACFGFAEAFMGSLEEQEHLYGLHSGSGTVLEWADIFMGILRSISIDSVTA